MVSPSCFPAQSLQAFAEFVPLCSDSHASTLLRPNLSHISNGSCPTFSTSSPTPCRIVKLSFAKLHGRKCFSFGSARSNDYLLPSSATVAPHHFILYIHPQDRALYIRNTCPLGLYVVGHNHVHSHIKTCDEPIEIASSLRIYVGGPNGLSFKVVNLLTYNMHEYDTNLAIYFNSLRRHVGHNDIMYNAAKRRHSSSAMEYETAKRRCVKEPGAEEALLIPRISVCEQYSGGWFGSVFWYLCSLFTSHMQ